MREFFTHKKLREFLLHIKSISNVTSLGNWDGTNGIILRHDVDLDIKAAYNLSLIEKECGVESTFFIVPTSRYYNPLSLANRKMLYEMANSGFEIGLHFDPMVYGNISINELKEKVDMEAKILEFIVNKEVKSVSLHNPSVHGQYPIFEGYNNAYEKKIFSDDVYISDSCMNFRGKHPFEFVKKAEEKTIQVVLHPIHYSEKGNNYIQILCNLHLKKIEDFDIHFRGNPTYLSLIKNERLIDYIIKEVKK